MSTSYAITCNLFLQDIGQDVITDFKDVFAMYVADHVEMRGRDNDFAADCNHRFKVF